MQRINPKAQWKGKRVIAATNSNVPVFLGSGAKRETVTSIVGSNASLVKGGWLNTMTGD